MNVPFSPRTLPSSWLTEHERGALEQPDRDIARAAVAAGRLVRSGALRAAEARACRAWIRDLLEPSLAYAVHASVTDWTDAMLDVVRRWASERPEIFEAIRDAFGGEVETPHPEAASLSKLWPIELIATRDDVESALASLAVAAIEREDDDVAAWLDASREAASGVDRVIAPVVDDLTDALRSSGARAPAHVYALAELEGSSWWIAAAERAGWSSVTGAALRSGRWPSPRLTLGAASQRVALQMGSTAGSPAIDEALSRDLGAPLATMHDGAVLVWAVGLGLGDAEEREAVAPGLVLRARENRLERVTYVALDPPGSQPPHRDGVALAIWVPLADVVVPHDLVVRFDDREERLLLDFVAPGAP